MSIAKVAPGTLVVSLDFELHWGNRDHRPLSGCRANLLGTREVVPRLLDLFRRHEIHATWATVGLVFCDDAAEARRAAPALRPTYTDPALSPYPSLESLSPSDAPFYFAPDLVERIVATPHQELATHTFSHFYCLEPGQTLEQFRADLVAAQQLSRRKLGRDLVSIVFPRNQFAPEHLAVCRELGIVAFRGSEGNAWSHAESRTTEARSTRALRLLDHYLPLSGANTFVPRTARDRPVDLPSSRFLRGYSPRLRALDLVKVARITGALRSAARTGEAFHLWWHPENFGTHTERNLELLEQVLVAFDGLRRDHGMRSLTMAELAHETAAAAPIAA